MPNFEYSTILTLAFGLGMLHALDADHIMAVSTLASKRPSLRQSLQFGLRWAIGHGSALLFIGIAFFVLGFALPQSLSLVAEYMVGTLLIIIGLWVLIDIAKQKLRLDFHQHEGLPHHAHWQSSHRHFDTSQSKVLDHSPLLIGLLHGVAGSAPLLAIIPVVQNGSLWYGITYLGLFGLGVLLSMLLFGGVLGVMYQHMSRYRMNLFTKARILIGLSSVCFGGYFLYTQ